VTAVKWTSNYIIQRFMGGPKHREQLVLYLYFCFVFYIFIIHFWIFLHYHLWKMCSCKNICLLYSSAFKPVTFCQWSFILFMYNVVWRSFYSCHQTSLTFFSGSNDYYCDCLQIDNKDIKSWFHKIYLNNNEHNKNMFM
jgi:hypothetical protein